MTRKQEKMVFVGKQVGETPLEALERWRATRKDLAGISLTYAGRLDPMAEGTLLILIGDECKNKAKYLGLDKEYEIEVVFGLATDTYDALGLVGERRGVVVDPQVLAGGPQEHVLTQNSKITTNVVISAETLKAYVGKFTQSYPPYSSKTVDGKQLHELARAGTLPDQDEMPTKDVEIHSIEELGKRTISSDELKKTILAKIALVRGDFRQKEIVARWKEVLENSPEATFSAIRLRVKCSSGTYMRSLADKIGKDLGSGAFALSIKRTKIIL